MQSTILTKTTNAGTTIEVWTRKGETIIAVNGTNYADTILPLKTPQTIGDKTVVAIGRKTKVGFTADEYSTIQRATRGITARFAGTCAKSGRRYGKGARIEQTMYGWALVGAELDATYNMTREDSPL